MAIKKALAVASLLLLAFALVPVAYAQNDGDGVTTARPHKVLDPAQRAARKAKRQHRREMRHEARMRRQGGPSAPSVTAPAPN